MNKVLRSIATSALAAALLIPGSAFAFQAKDTSSKTAVKAMDKTTPASAPSDKDIADAKTKGMVWVNTTTKVYHKDGQFYGKTKRGQFMTEADAQKAGFRAAQDPGSSKKTTKK